MRRTEREQEILNNWPAPDENDLISMNDRFQHYIFFRRTTLCKQQLIMFFTSCCGSKFEIPIPRRVELPYENELISSCAHNAEYVCPKCGRKVIMKDLGRGGQRKGLVEVKLVLLLHNREDALYADALALRKWYENEADLTAKPEVWCSSGYRFAPGEVMMIDYQVWDGKGCVSWERNGLGRRKLVTEPFRVGSANWYRYESYEILNREAVEQNQFFRYCGYFDHWTCSTKSYWKGQWIKYYSDFVSYLTAYCMYPRQIELLVKAGLQQPVEELIYHRKKFAGSMDWSEPDIRKSLKLSKDEMRYVLKYRTDFDVLAFRNYANRSLGMRWTVQNAVYYYGLWRDHLRRFKPLDVLRFCRGYKLDPERLVRYLGDQLGSPTDGGFISIPAAFESYRDYLEAAYHIGMCMEHSKVLFPEALGRAHDEATAAWATALESAEEAGMVDRDARAKKYEFELDGLSIVLPRSGAAIRREGRMLVHCVAGYAERHMKGVLTILFLRKTEALGTPYVTLEMHGNQLVQIHGYMNDAGRVSPRKLHKQFLDTWLDWLARGSKRDEQGKPKLPRRREKVTAA